jgi:hypothetical protein
MRIKRRAERDTGCNHIRDEDKSPCSEETGCNCFRDEDETVLRGDGMQSLQG